jgi:hypothetical protein
MPTIRCGYPRDGNGIFCNSRFACARLRALAWWRSTSSLHSRRIRYAHDEADRPHAERPPLSLAETHIDDAILGYGYPFDFSADAFVKSYDDPPLSVWREFENCRSAGIRDIYVAPSYGDVFDVNKAGSLVDEC